MVLADLIDRHDIWVIEGDYGARFLLGAAEAGFFPGVIVYLSHWFIQEDRAKATSNFMAAIPVSLVIGSPVAGWILSHNWFAIEGWRWLFFLEGIPAIVLLCKHARWIQRTTQKHFRGRPVSALRGPVQG